MSASPRKKAAPSSSGGPNVEAEAKAAGAAAARKIKMKPVPTEDDLAKARLQLVRAQEQSKHLARLVQENLALKDISSEIGAALHTQVATQTSILADLDSELTSTDSEVVSTQQHIEALMRQRENMHAAHETRMSSRRERHAQAIAGLLSDLNDQRALFAANADLRAEKKALYEALDVASAEAARARHSHHVTVSDREHLCLLEKATLRRGMLSKLASTKLGLLGKVGHQLHTTTRRVTLEHQQAALEVAYQSAVVERDTAHCDRAETRLRALRRAAELDLQALAMAKDREAAVQRRLAKEAVVLAALQRMAVTHDLKSYSAYKKNGKKLPASQQQQQQRSANASNERSGVSSANGDASASGGGGAGGGVSDQMWRDVGESLNLSQSVISNNNNTNSSNNHGDSAHGHTAAQSQLLAPSQSQTLTVTLGPTTNDSSTADHHHHYNNNNSNSNSNTDSSGDYSAGSQSFRGLTVTASSGSNPSHNNNNSNKNSSVANNINTAAVVPISARRVSATSYGSGAVATAGVFSKAKLARCPYGSDGARRINASVAANTNLHPLASVNSYNNNNNAAVQNTMNAAASLNAASANSAMRIGSATIAATPATAAAAAAASASTAITGGGGAGRGSNSSTSGLAGVTRALQAETVTVAGGLRALLEATAQARGTAARAHEGAQRLLRLQ